MAEPPTPLGNARRLINPFPIGGLMDPRKSYNYGTFIAPPGYCAEKTHLEGGTANFSQGFGAPVSTITASDYRVLSAGLQLAKHGVEVVISQMDDDVARVSRASRRSRWSSLSCVLVMLCWSLSPH